MKRFSDSELRYVRNEIPIKYVLEQLCGICGKQVEGVYRFVCPCCHEMQTGIHPKENLVRCFRCRRNFNPLELVMQARSCSFVVAVKYLLSERTPCPIPHSESNTPNTSSADRLPDLVPIGDILAQLARN